MSDMTSYISTALRKKVFTNSEFEEDADQHGQTLKVNFWNRFVLANVEIREFNRMVKSLETSGGLLNPSECKSMFLALKRLFYCSIRAPYAASKADGDSEKNLGQIELSSIVTDSKQKIKEENLTQIHLG
jgi:hypothetical protein